MTETDHEELAAARAAFDSHESSQDAVVLAIPAPESVRRRFESIERLCAAEGRKRELRLALLADLPAGVWLGGVA